MSLSPVLQGLSVGAVAVTVSGCATPPGKLKPEDLSLQVYSVKKPPAEVFTGLQEYSRACGGLLGGNLPDWYPGSPGGKSRVDLHLPNVFVTRSSFVYSTIEITGQDTSDVKVGVQHVYAKSIFGKPDGWKDKAAAMFHEIELAAPPICP